MHDPDVALALITLLAFLGLSREHRPSSTDSDEVLAKDRSPSSVSCPAVPVREGLRSPASSG